MNKILSTFFILLIFVCIILTPLFVGIHSVFMHHHNMSMEECIEHCIGEEKIAETPKIVKQYVLKITFVVQIIFAKIYQFFIPLTLLYILLAHSPPNIYRSISNYDYPSLIGIIKMTT